MKLLFCIMAGCLLTSGIHSLSFTTINGGTVSLGSYSGKKLLLVNIATTGPYAAQLAGLQTLQSRYAGSLVVIGFPSDAFGHEPRGNAAIKAWCAAQGISFPLSQKVALTGPAVSPVYRWLTTQTENGVMNQPVRGDFQKYLVDGEGNLLGVFAGSVSPLDSAFINAITAN